MIKQLRNLLCPARWGLLVTVAMLLSSFWTENLFAQPLSEQRVQNTIIYTDGLAAGRDDWSWDTTRSLEDITNAGFGG